MTVLKVDILAEQYPRDSVPCGISSQIRNSRQNTTAVGPKTERGDYFNKDKYRKILIPVVIPFTEQGDVDYRASVSIREMLLEKGWADTFILTGTTGEFFSMTAEERWKVFKTMKDAFGDRIPIIPGTGAPSTREAIAPTASANISATIVGELAKDPNIVGIKEEAELNPKQITEFLNVTPASFIVYDADDTMVLESSV